MDNQDPNSSKQQPLSPGDRLRKILAASEDGEAQEIPHTGIEMPPTAEDNSQDGTTDGEEQAPPASDAPTGPHHVDDSGVSSTNRHPTGQPDSTGGWYGEGDLSHTSAFTPEEKSQSGTVPPPSKPASDDSPTQPVKVQTGNTGRTVQSGRVYNNQPNRPDMPLPQRVDEVDRHATRVTPTAYGSAPGHDYDSTVPGYSANQPPQQPYGNQGGYGGQPGYPTQRGYGSYPPQSGYPRAGYPPAGAPPARPVARKRGRGRRGTWGCFVQGLIAMLFVGVILVLIAGSYGVYQYFRIASTLPPVGDLRNKASKFETTRILDRNGNVLYEILDPNAGRRTYVPLKKISPYLIAATIATEDKEFWSHPGFDPVAIIRALWQNYTTGGIASGASTITQQLARTLLLSPNERVDRTVERKAREIVLAAEITRRYSKEDILELYLNENYYGNLAYGVEAAAETYFQSNAGSLTLSQASFLAGLPQAPAVYDIYTNRAATLNRQKAVLTLMYQTSQDKNCIDVVVQSKPVCVSAADAQKAAKEIEAYNFDRPSNNIKYPHWVNYIRSLLEEQFDAQTIYRSGFTVYTTIDPTLQEKAEEIVKQQVDTLADRHVTDGALVSIRPSTGEILAMVGSADFFNKDISGQVNMAISPRQPGSSIKPLTYVAAFEKGWTPATLIWDVPSEFPPSGDPNDSRDPYEPGNYDGQFHGPVTVRTALANSYNIPAVKTLQFVGIYDDPNTPAQDGVINFAKRMGITTLNRSDYGLSLTLGGGEVTVLEMTSAFGVFANSGVRVPPVSITKIADYAGNTVYEYQPSSPEQVIRPEHAFLISSILSDNEARTPAFGANSVLNMPFQAAVKTGTTNDYRDNWTLGYTPDLVTGVWVGNADYTPMNNTSGVTGAAPIWSQYMQYAVPTITGGNPTPFSRPQGIVDKVICTVSGAEPSEYCPSQRGEVFAYDQLPAPKKDDLWQKVNVDTWTGLRASAACSDFAEEKFSLNVTDKWAIRWIRENDEGRGWAEQMGFKEPIFFTPDRDCKLEDPRPTVLFAGLSENQTITSAPLDIYAVINATKNFKNWRLDWGIGDDPVEWKELVKGSTKQYKDPQKIATWDMEDAPPDKDITLRIYMNSTKNTYAERKIKIHNSVPTATPTPTPTATSTDEPTITPTNLPTFTKTAVPPTFTPTPTTTPEPVSVGGTPAITATSGGFSIPGMIKTLFAPTSSP